jgi:hypothetical protein
MSSLPLIVSKAKGVGRSTNHKLHAHRALQTKNLYTLIDGSTCDSLESCGSKISQRKKMTLDHSYGIVPTIYLSLNSAH